MIPATTHGMTPCPARPYTEPPFACYATAGGLTCRECGCGFATIEAHTSGRVVGLSAEGAA
jgi:hypothetical protein